MPLYRSRMRDSNAENSRRDAEERGEDHLLHHELTRAIIGAFYAVHSKLGTGFLERVYANALAVMLRKAGYHVAREVPFEIFFEGVSVGFYRADMVVESKIVVETKVARRIIDDHGLQLLNNLRASKLEVGLVLNFARKPELKRVVMRRK